MPNSLGMSDEEYSQLTFYAGLVGLTPEQYAERAAEQPTANPRANEAGQGRYSSVPQGYIDRNNATLQNPNAPGVTEYDRQVANAAQSAYQADQKAQNPNQYYGQQLSDYMGSRANINQPLVDQFGGFTAGAMEGQNRLQGENQAIAARGQQNAQDLQRWNQDLVGFQGQSAASANAADQQIYRDYAAQLQHAQQFDMQNYGGLMQQYGQYGQLQAGGYGANVPSMGSQVYANPQLVAQQQAAYGNLAGASGGSLDYRSQAAQAYANPQLVAQQQQAAQQLYGTSQGALNQVSQAQYAYANQQDVQNQQMAAARLQASGNGAEDVRTQNLAGYSQMQGAQNGLYDVNMGSLQGAQDLRGVGQGSLNLGMGDVAGSDALWGAANGSKDVDWRNVQGMQDLYDVAGGSKDTRVGQEDPAAYASQQDALAKYTEGTDPRVTGEERLIYETARLRQEADERGNREAQLTDLRQRGAMGSGYEIAQGQLGSQQNSTNRMLSDLGALSNATQRGERMLAGQAGLATSMSNQGDLIAMNNADRQLQGLSQFANNTSQFAAGNADRQMGALGQYVDTSRMLNQGNQGVQANAIGQYAGLETDVAQNNMNRRYDATSTIFGTDAQVQSNNADRRVQAQGMASQAYAELRAQGFSEEYARRSAADTMARFNADLQFQGQQAYYGASSDMRSQDFNETYSRGTAADTASNNNMNRRLGAMGMQYDAASDMRGQDFSEQSYRADSADAMAQFNKSQSQISQRWQEQYAAEQQNSAWGRDTDMYRAGTDLSATYRTDAGNLAQGGWGVNNAAYGRNSDFVRTGMEAGGQTFGALQQANGTSMGVNGAGQALLGQQTGMMGDWLGAATRQNDAVTGIGASQIATMGGAYAADRAEKNAYNTNLPPPAGGGGGGGSFWGDINRGFAKFANGEY